MMKNLRIKNPSETGGYPDKQGSGANISRCRHGFLIPVVALSAAGIMACTIWSAVTRAIGGDDLVMSGICLAGALIVCIGRRRAYGWMTFKRFLPEDMVCYCLILAALCVCSIVGFLRSAFFIRDMAAVFSILFSALMRSLLSGVRCNYPFDSPILQENGGGVHGCARQP